MAYGLQVWNSAGTLTFDSTVAIGGVCLGFYTVPSGGGNTTFPEITGATGIVLQANSGGPINTTLVTTDNTLGYLRFTFDATLVGQTYTLFAK
jgi:hypothetical protein